MSQLNTSLRLVSSLVLALSLAACGGAGADADDVSSSDDAAESSVTPRRRSIGSALTVPPPLVGHAIAPQGPPPIPSLTTLSARAESSPLASEITADLAPVRNVVRKARLAGAADDDASDDAVPTDSLALGDTGPVPKAEP